jgi:hypothetical protein
VVIEGGKDQKKEPPYGADVLRLWVSSVDYSSDVMVGPGILKQISESYRKVGAPLRGVGVGVGVGVGLGAGGCGWGVWGGWGFGR